MNSRNDPTDSANMSAEERVAEIATILAAGVLRLHLQARISTANPPIISPVESSQNNLDECGTESLNGHRGSPKEPCEREEK